MSASTNPQSDRGAAPYRVAPGFNVGVFAEAPIITNLAAFSVDAKGRLWISENHRRNTSTIDIRSQTNWLDADLSFRSVTDRSNFLTKVLAPKNTSAPAWMRRDLNGDGHFDYHDLAVESERIRLLEDRNSDGRAESAITFTDGFSTVLTGTAGGILTRATNVWFACAPDLWLIRDLNNDGHADERKSLLHGFSVHIGLPGHDLHGLCLGPDGKIYFTIGDCGFNVSAPGRAASYPDTGGVLRCNPDGSELEVLATGLRNPQGLAFDQLGNLWTVDEPGDGRHKGRLMLVLEGADGGWHVGWQHLDNLGAWYAEKLWEIPPANSAAYVLPPVALIGNQPAGFAAYPGTGLPERYDHHFFLCDASGTVLSFAVQPKGASYLVFDVHEFFGGQSPSDVDFAPGGGVYIADLPGSLGAGRRDRIYYVFDPVAFQASEITDTKNLLAEGFQRHSPRELIRLLEHRDRRVRQEAQFALADKGTAATNQLLRAAAKNANPVARLHAIWALGRIAGPQPDTLTAMLPLLGDPEPEVRAQAAKMLGEGRLIEALEPLARLLQDPSPRVRMFAAFGLGKLGRQEATEPILQMLRDNADRDPFLRHAGVMALVWLNDMNALVAAAKDSSASVRMGVLLAMRRLARPEIAMFLYDPNPALVLEAARAIYDLPIESAWSQLAVLVNSQSKLRNAKAEASGTVELRTPVLRRALCANFRLGKLENALALADFSARREFPEGLRAEALRLLAQWPKRVLRDPILGVWRPSTPKESRPASLAIRNELPKILREAGEPVRIAAVQTAVQLEINSVAPVLRELVTDTKLGPPLRVEALRALAQFKDTQLSEVAAAAAADPAEPLRAEAARWFVPPKPSDALAQITIAIEKGNLAEKQAALAKLVGLSDPAADQIVLAWLDLLREGKVPGELQLDLLEGARKRPAQTIQLKVEQYEAAREKSDPIAAYREALYGGNTQAGQKLFIERADLECTRCHRVRGAGGDLGPDLTSIGASRTREQLLESILWPSKQMSPGFEISVVTMKSGRTYKGRIKNETARELLLTSTEDGFLVLGKNQIQVRERGASLMPAELGKKLSKRELRDLIEYLASLR
ncbi:MAG: HEAT repeat domain-containing protein [Verrucomicrobia bacterium]|nr:HEAT repeat domain-containing protein [Verrucomicrobiota bacterium]